ncbi:MAG: ATP-dependent RNA helicase RhlE [Sulfuricurvum sp. GWF2_44_89]|uniref:DEAD/DEAH box helicase n=1 Tax=unclassified Sulfuricurvum TaxID=2632390 RepID=UPI0008C51204|nr:MULTISPECIES: DEAD/DEAH box helicase [unclassified Sulfuricurvum]OHD77018.1 MAG: ATP-dependent RNA helicase RhlE [Sulfuricurvum sp. GWF2_44_89]OHD94971.1 MAG: ATP-dependent RNA helicase RhlE [Sulfuricurvum sp. RIFOXYD12_FULL_44_77]OHD99270.1 MAG: ATP-dependent RNA helicase RhlE [Sulfuricurvum sp. RIFOXYD2_FULL_44_160]
MTFTDLNLNASLLKAISDQGYTTPTPVQAQAIPFILEGRDMLAGAQTGTGKTAGFTLPMLQILSDKKTSKPHRKIRALILTPTRELAAQVAESVKIYGKYLPLKSAVIFGGVGINPQITMLRNGIDILIATPGRLLDHVGQGTVDLSAVEFFILDEADRMLDMGFIRDIRRVITILPKARQNLLFSATYSDDIKTLASTLLRNPAEVEVARRNTSSELVKQSVILVDCKRKSALLGELIGKNKWEQVLVFTCTKHGANKLTEYLQKIGITAAAIHGNKSQAARTKALNDFKCSSVRVLVATDIAARGIDIDALPHVVNFELPNIAEDYVHRIGRTGRAGCEGEAISLVCVDEADYLRGIEKLINKKLDSTIVEGYEPDPSIKAEPIQRGRGGAGGGGGNRGGNGGGDRGGKPTQKRDSGRHEPKRRDNDRRH